MGLDMGRRADECNGDFSPAISFARGRRPLAVGNDAANGVLPGLLPYGGEKLCGAVASSPSGETCRIDSEDFLSCNVRSTKINLDITRKGG